MNISINKFNYTVCLIIAILVVLLNLIGSYNTESFHPEGMVTPNTYYTLPLPEKNRDIHSFNHNTQVWKYKDQIPQYQPRTYKPNTERLKELELMPKIEVYVDID